MWEEVNKFYEIICWKVLEVLSVHLYDFNSTIVKSATFKKSYHKHFHRFYEFLKWYFSYIIFIHIYSDIHQQWKC